ncbi:MAG: hypothetical protein WBP93_06320 [Pyrinomonadaceae bacterium]
MMPDNSSAAPACPYKGLQPFTEEDREYFFGRESDRETVASNLLVAPLTILYGTSGVGKSSILRAGVIPQLTQTPHVCVIFFNSWQNESFSLALKRDVLRGMCECTGRSEADVLKGISEALESGDETYGESEGRRDVEATQRPTVETLALDSLLFGSARAFRKRLLLIFDQFEEYFLYHPPTSGAQGFEAEFARAINRNEANVNFMISMREEELSKLDRFRARVPVLLANLLRLKHLDDEAVGRAIREPLRVYSEKYPAASMDIENPLVTRIINDLKGIEPVQQKTAAPAVATDSERRIEMPYLQLVMTRLWNEEVKAGSHSMKISTLEKIGGTQKIVRTYLSEVMSNLPYVQRVMASRLLSHLVTPSGTKIALSAGDLANYADVPRKRIKMRVEPLLQNLSSPNIRLLRIVEGTTKESEVKYEIFHDALAAAILDWRASFQSRRRLYKILVVLSVVSVIVFIPTLFILRAMWKVRAPTESLFVSVIVAIVLALILIFIMLLPIALGFFLGAYWARSK